MLIPSAINGRNEMTIVDINQASHITIRAKPGVYVRFPIVNNKGIFDHFTTSTLKDCFVIDCLHGSESDVFGLYQIKSGIKHLVNAFSDKSELTVETIDIIVNYFPHMIEALGIEVTFTIITDISHMPNLKFELIAKINSRPYIIAVIDDIEKLTTREKSKIKKFPGALAAIDKYIALMEKKTEKSHL